MKNNTVEDIYSFARNDERLKQWIGHVVGGRIEYSDGTTEKFTGLLEEFDGHALWLKTRNGKRIMIARERVCQLWEVE